MRPYLTMGVVAPMGSFGEPAPNERRGTALRPTRSAVLGLLGGAMGIGRAERDLLVEMTAGYGVATRMIPGFRNLLDYHSVQSPSEEALHLPRARGAPLVRRHHASRGDALRAARPDTQLTRRDYLCDVMVAVALWSRGTARWSLDDLAAGLRRPAFAPYLGRLSCPLSAPLRPVVVEAVDAVDALGTVTFPAFDDGMRTHVERRMALASQAGLDGDDPAALSPGRVGHDRGDVPYHDLIRRYGPRREWVVPVPCPAPTQGALRA